MDELDEVGEWTCNREGSGKNKIVSVYLDYRDEDWNEANIEEWTDVHNGRLMRSIKS